MIDKSLVIAIPDLHLPFPCMASVKKALKYVKQSNPYIVIQMGDLYDMYSFNRYGTKPVISPTDEVSKGHFLAVKFWEAVHKVAPRAKKIQIKGNHDIRALKRDETSGGFFSPLLEMSLKEMFTFKGVETIHDPRDHFEYNGVIYTHGHRKHGDHMSETGKPTVTGHLHRGLITYKRMCDASQIWEMSAGYLGNPYHEALLYRPMRKFFNWNTGLGKIDKHGPQFIAL